MQQTTYLRPQANVSDDTGWSALTWSMMHGSLEIVKLLVLLPFPSASDGTKLDY